MTRPPSSTFFQPHRWEFWVFSLIVATGLVQAFAAMTGEAGPTFSRFSGNLLLWALSVLPAIVCLRWLDVPEQTGWTGIALALLWGAFGFFGIATLLGSLPTFLRIATDLGFACVGVGLLVRLSPARFTTLLSVVATAIAVGLGEPWATVMASDAQGSIFVPGPNAANVDLGHVARQMLSGGPWIAAISAGVAVAGVVAAQRSSEGWRRRYGAAAAAIGLAAALRFLPMVPMLPTVALGIPALVALLALRGVALREPATHLMERAQRFVPEPELISTEERQSLATLEARLAARRRAAQRGGAPLARALRALQRAQLAFLASCDPTQGRGMWSRRAEEAVRDARWVYRAVQGLA
jgi:hypothetical protein